ncbi:MAG TPA: hypothetical protein VEB63_08180 [Chitinophagaceae bacterium]|nr:hypothetical protein [Chitinophagaceae bacterium]
MKKQLRDFFVFAFLLFQTLASSAQIKDILKAGGKVLDKSPSKLVEKYFSNAPITTSFDHAVTEVDLLGNFDPGSGEALPLSSLAQDASGNYLVVPGYYSGMNMSFCMKAGTYGPSRGDGHLYAPLMGPKSALMRNILENWQTKAPHLSQSTVQGLIWAIIARTDIDKMDIKYKAALLALLDKDDVAQLAAGSLKDKALEAGMNKLKGEIPSEIYRVFEAEKELRRLYSSASTTYEDLERYAVLAGIAPEADMIRPVSKARWSYHPNGYFLRMFPSGYSSTRVDVYLPYNVQSEADQFGRITAVSYPNYRIEFGYDKPGAGNTSPSLVSLKLTVEGVIRTVGLTQLSLRPDFLTTDFSFDPNAAPAGTRLANYAKWFRPPGGPLSFRVDAAGKRKAFNLASLALLFENIPESTLDKHLNANVRFMLNEAHNHIIFTNLVYDPGHKARVSSGSATDNAINSGPQFINDPIRNEDADHFINEPYSQDRGSLDLPNTVATPANRSAQRIGQSKPPKQPPWYDKLPDCPCTYKEAQTKAKQSGSGWMDCGKANQTYHYGATTEVRWKPNKPGQPGQQCTYDAEGNLITSGVGAGSPDKVSPQGCGPQDGIQYGEVRNFLGHNAQDMQTWENLPCWQYLRDWPANNGNKCATNPKNDLQHIRKLVGDMNCRDFTTLMENANNRTGISKKLKDFLNGNGSLSEQELIGELKDWKINSECHGQPLCGVIDQAIANLR